MRSAYISMIVLGCIACSDSSSDAEPGVDTAAPGAGVAGSAAPAITPAGQAPVAAAPSTPAATPGSSAARPTPAGSAPGAAAAPASAPAPGATPTVPASPTPATAPAMAMDECGLDTKWEGDEYCINPPPEDKGFQLHIGPSDYENPGDEYILQPGDENVIDMQGVSGNKQEVYYYYRQYRMRPGSHHVIVTASGGDNAGPGGALGGFGGGGRRIGGTQNLAKDNPEGGIAAPENEGVGMPLSPNTTLNLNMHYYNVTDKPIIREVWINFWYKDAASVTEPALQLFSPTGVSDAVAHSHVVLGASCPVEADGRILTLYGHRHNNNQRFSVFRTRGGQKDLIFNDYDAKHPGVIEFNSLIENEVPDLMTNKPGGFSGPLDLKSGDVLDFECEILNNTDKNFTGANEANDDEMCIMVGETVGASVAPFCTPITTRRLDGAN